MDDLSIQWKTEASAAHISLRSTRLSSMAAIRFNNSHVSSNVVRGLVSYSVSIICILLMQSRLPLRLMKT